MKYLQFFCKVQIRTIWYKEVWLCVFFAFLKEIISNHSVLYLHRAVFIKLSNGTSIHFPADKIQECCSNVIFLTFNGNFLGVADFQQFLICCINDSVKTISQENCSTQSRKIKLLQSSSCRRKMM